MSGVVFGVSEVAFKENGLVFDVSSERALGESEGWFLERAAVVFGVSRGFWARVEILVCVTVDIVEKQS